MNTATPEKKDFIVKILAIVGFLVIIGLIALMSIQVVSYAPKAFTSLASIADGLEQYKEAVSESDEDLIVESDSSEVTSGKPAVVTWTKDRQNGSYAFVYDCMEGLTVSVVSAEGLRAIDCDTSYSLGDAGDVTIIPESTKSESLTLTYSVVFSHDIDPEQKRSGSASLAVVGGVPPKSDEAAAPEDETPDPTPKPSTPIVTAPTIEYVIPTSDPNGRIDLGTIFLATGAINNNRFVAGTLRQDREGAFQFEVKNYGTKTSEKWTYKIFLPDGESYTSPEQAPLKPNERAVIAIGFPATDDTTHTFAVVVTTEKDVNKSNDSFRKTVSFLK